MDVGMDIDLDLLFGFSTNNNNTNTNTNANNVTQNGTSSTTTTTTVQLTNNHMQHHQSESIQSNKSIQHQLQIQQQQQQPQHVQLTNVQLTNDHMSSPSQNQGQNRTSIVVLTPIHSGHSTHHTIGQVIGQVNTNHLNLTSVQLTNVPLPLPPSTPSKDHEICKIQLITLTDKTGAELKTSYLVVKSVPLENVNTKKDNFRVKGSNTVYNCQLCPYKTPKIKSIKEHLVNHKPYPDSIKCRYCDYYSPYTLTLQQHEVLHREYVPLANTECMPNGLSNGEHLILTNFRDFTVCDGRVKLFDFTKSFDFRLRVRFNENWSIKSI